MPGKPELITRSNTPWERLAAASFPHRIQELGEGRAPSAATIFPDDPRSIFRCFTETRAGRIIRPVAMSMPSPLLPGPELCTEAEITRLVHEFYAQVRIDPMLGPIFGEHVADWPAHLDLLVDFWSAMLRGTRRFRGAPMSKHLVLPGLSSELFAQWLRLFHQVTATLGNPAMQAQADAMAERIAETFWQRYRLQHRASLPTIPTGRSGSTP